MPIPATATPEQLFTYMLAHAASFRMDVLEHHEERTTSTLPGCGSQVIGSDRIKTSLLVVGSVPHVVFMYSNVRLLLSVPELLTWLSMLLSCCSVGHLLLFLLWLVVRLLRFGFLPSKQAGYVCL